MYQRDSIFQNYSLGNNNDLLQSRISQQYKKRFTWKIYDSFHTLGLKHLYANIQSHLHRLNWRFKKA